MYNFEIDRIIRTVKNNNYKTIGLQLPEGLRDYATEVVDNIRSKVDCEIIISSNSCYGACDLADEEMGDLGVEILFHFGHSLIIKNTKIPVEYIEVRIDIDPIPLISKNLEKLGKKIGLVTTVQYAHLLTKIKDFLEKKGFEVFIGEAKGRAKYKGQILGCSFSSAKDIADKVDNFLYVGSGDFHPLGIALATGKKTLIFDLEKLEVRGADNIKEEVLRKRAIQIAKAKDGETFGVIIGEKRGQTRKNLALDIMKRLKRHGKEGYMISLKEITPENLISFRKLDALINTACPRVAIDDAERFKQPLLTPIELEIVLGERRLEDYKLDEIP